MGKLARLSLSIPALALSCMLLTSCSSSDEDSGTPTLSNLTLDKTELTVGETTTVKVTVNYADPEGDVISLSEQQVQGNLVGPESQLSIPDASGKTTGTFAFALQLGAPQAGTFTLQFWVNDKLGHKSEKLMATITAK